MECANRRTVPDTCLVRVAAVVNQCRWRTARLALAVNGSMSDLILFGTLAASIQTSVIPSCMEATTSQGFFGGCAMPGPYILAKVGRLAYL